MLESVIVKELTTIEQIEEARQLEHAIWAIDSIPVHQTIASIRNGGLVLGAYLEGQLIGFNYSFPGYVDGETYLYSHMLGIKREFRELGVGELIKIYQKEIAGSRGYRKCKWTFDPLEACNGYLNFAKLRSYSSTYIANCYGEMEDPLNRVLPTDRLFVEWQLVDDDYLRWDAKVEELIEGAEPVVPWTLNPVGLPMLDKENTFETSTALIRDAYLLPVPHYFQKLKVESPSLAEDWRYKTRTILQSMFEQGYIIIHTTRHNEHVNHYLLIKRTLFAL